MWKKIYSLKKEEIENAMIFDPMIDQKNVFYWTIDSRLQIKYFIGEYISLSNYEESYTKPECNN